MYYTVCMCVYNKCVCVNQSKQGEEKDISNNQIPQNKAQEEKDISNQLRISKRPKEKDVSNQDRKSVV